MLLHILLIILVTLGHADSAQTSCSPGDTGTYVLNYILHQCASTQSTVTDTPIGCMPNNALTDTMVAFGSNYKKDLSSTSGGITTTGSITFQCSKSGQTASYAPINCITGKPGVGTNTMLPGATFYSTDTNGIPLKWTCSADTANNMLLLNWAQAGGCVEGGNFVAVGSQYVVKNGTAAYASFDSGYVYTCTYKNYQYSMVFGGLKLAINGQLVGVNSIVTVNGVSYKCTQVNGEWRLQITVTTTSTTTTTASTTKSNTTTASTTTTTKVTTVGTTTTTMAPGTCTATAGQFSYGYNTTNSFTPNGKYITGLPGPSSKVLSASVGVPGNTWPSNSWYTSGVFAITNYTGQPKPAASVNLETLKYYTCRDNKNGTATWTSIGCAYINPYDNSWGLLQEGSTSNNLANSVPSAPHVYYKCTNGVMVPLPEAAYHCNTTVTNGVRQDEDTWVFNYTKYTCVKQSTTAIVKMSDQFCHFILPNGTDIKVAQSTAYSSSVAPVLINPANFEAWRCTISGGKAFFWAVSQAEYLAVFGYAASGGLSAGGGDGSGASSNLPVACVWDEWTSFDSCSVSCGGGIQTRSRAVLTAALNGGTSCSGSATETNVCGTNSCPIDCVLSEWTAFTACDKTCGGGHQTQSRQIQTAAQFGGAECTGETTNSQTCNEQLCPVDCVWGEWSAFTDCSVSCGDGTKSQSRSHQVEAANNGAACTGPSTQTATCNKGACPVDAQWGDWSAWSTCSAACGAGTQTATREIIVPASDGGAQVIGDHTRSQECKLTDCAVDCQWDAWTEWDSCSLPCGGGTQSRTRAIKVQSAFSGKSCDGGTSDSQSCNSQPCPVNCVWSSWEDWSTCDKQCGTGSQTRIRHAIGPQNGGTQCEGASDDRQDCNTNPCAVDCVMAQWTPYASCSATCGDGTQTRTRTVTTPAEHGGKVCESELSQTQPCNEKNCAVNCVWGEWTLSQPCNATCGGGKLINQRAPSQAALYGGAACEGDNFAAHDCNMQPCPVNGQWGEWSDWSACSQECGSGSQSRRREVTVQPLNGGAPVEGETTDQRVCNEEECTVECHWTEWTEWSDCSKPCGTGLKKRTRSHNPDNTEACNGQGADEQMCNTQQCPINCEWDEWTAWTACSVSCGNGTTQRVRSEKVAAQFGGAACEGEQMESKTCSPGVPCQVPHNPATCKRGHAHKSKSSLFAQCADSDVKGQRWDECAAQATCDDLHPKKPATCGPGCMCPRGWVVKGGKCQNGRDPMVCPPGPGGHNAQCPPRQHHHDAPKDDHSH